MNVGGVPSFSLRGVFGLDSNFRADFLRMMRQQTTRRLAEKAHISTATVVSISQTLGSEAFTPIPLIVDADAPTHEQQRKNKGLLRSYIKLSIALELDPWRAVSELFHCDVEGYLESIFKETQSLLVDKKQGGDKGLKIGLFQWPPFYTTERDPERGNAWAEDYMFRLIKLVDPDAPLACPGQEDLDCAINSLLSDERNGDHLDLLFGVYESAARIHSGLDFVSLPGIEVKLDCISPEPSITSWEYLMNLREDNTCIPLVVRYDVGRDYIKGSCGFRGVKECNSFDPKEIAQEFIKLNEKYLRGDRFEKYSPLVCDASTAKKVKVHVDEMLIKAQLSGLKAFEGGEDSPSYRVGIAISKKCEAVNREILIFAQRRELFNNSRYITARQYLKLFDQDKNNVLKFTYPTSDFNHYYWDRFLETLEEVAKSEHKWGKYVRMISDRRQGYSESKLTKSIGVV